MLLENAKKMRYLTQMNGRRGPFITNTKSSIMLRRCYGVGVAAATLPSDMRNMKAAAASFALVEVMFFHGQAVLPPPCKPLLQCEHP